MDPQQFVSIEMYITYVFLGVTMFFVGMLVNIHSDHILRNLRKPGETGYKIPQGMSLK